MSKWARLPEVDLNHTPWKFRRLLTLETRMQVCRRNSRRGSPRRVDTGRRRRTLPCGWFFVDTRRKEFEVEPICTVLRTAACATPGAFASRADPGQPYATHWLRGDITTSSVGSITAWHAALIGHGSHRLRLSRRHAYPTTSPAHVSCARRAPQIRAGRSATNEQRCWYHKKSCPCRASRSARP